MSLRHHVVSLAAVFLALALGVVLGSTSLSEGVLSGLREDNSSLESDLGSVQDERDALREQVGAADGFQAALAPRALRGTLDQRSVLVITAPGAESADRDAVVELIARAGGTVTGQVSLSEAFVDPNTADQLRTTLTDVIPAGVELPTGAVDQGSLAGALLGSVLVLDPGTGQPRGTPDELSTVLQALQAGGFIGLGDGASGAGVQPAELAVVLTGGAVEGDAAGDRAATVARFAAALDRAGTGVVLAGRAASAEGNGPVGVARADTDISATLTTVDNVGTSAGRITTVLGLREQVDGQAGRYGTAGSAQDITVGTVADGG